MGNFNVKELFKLKEGLAYLSSNKVRIAGYKYKWNKKVFNDYLSLIKKNIRRTK